jgi:hypothetical protein
MMEVGRRLASVLPASDHRVIEGQDQAVSPDLLAPIVAELLRT